MRTPMMTLTALAALALIPTASVGATVQSPHAGTVTATTYFPSGAFHGAVDIAPSGACRSWAITGPFAGAVYWNITINSTVTTCTAATGNVAVHTFADGWQFRIKDFIKSAASVDKTCDRCALGDSGFVTHFQHSKSGTYDTSWYSGYTFNGEAIELGETLGVLN